MSLLLDTHTALWFFNNDEALSTSAKAQIENYQGRIYVSIASLWEVGIKVSVGKLTLPGAFVDFFTRQLNLNQIEILSISLEHLHTITTLPHHHRDPFDRLIIAQALSEQMPVVGTDTVFDLYGISRIW
jgi:PIN domain nuclease of toxin-antitoxin system